MADSERIDTLISHLIAHGDRHAQQEWVVVTGALDRARMAEWPAAIGGHCGTTACAGGWAILLFGTDGEVLALAGLEPDQAFGVVGAYAQTDLNILETARRILGLTRQQAEFIFAATAILGSPRSEEAAIMALKHVKDHPDADRYDLLAACGLSAMPKLG